METNAELVPKLSKNCDECKLRKVRCVSELRTETPLVDRLDTNYNIFR